MNTTRHTFHMSEAQAELVHRVVDSHTQALKNWIVSAVESDQPGRAKNLVAELRQYQALYAAFNMRSKRETAEYSGRAMETEHRVDLP